MARDEECFYSTSRIRINWHACRRFNGLILLPLLDSVSFAPEGKLADPREQRRLAAIFAADMVGYSRLMEADERGTIARHKAHRSELIDPTITKHRGRIVKLMGDGMLVEFASVVDAVECAVAVQRVMEEREAEVPDDHRIQYRVGINLGDIVIEGEDIFGDGCQPSRLSISTTHRSGSRPVARAM